MSLDAARAEPSALELAASRANQRRDEALGHDAAYRRRHGVVHTPWQLARFVAAAADAALRQHLQCARGLADPATTVFDPACGPGAFLAAARAHAGAGVRGPRALIGWDIDGRAVALAERVLAAAQTHVDLREADTLGVAPEPGELGALRGPLAVMVNPPWAAGGVGPPGAPLGGLLEDFGRDAAGAPLAERKAGVLSDAYVRFMRWVSELLRRHQGPGVLGLVTNGSFLDGPVHRGLRARLCEWFDHIDVVDLGGNALLARAPGDDANVFGVRTSVAVMVAARHAGVPEPRGARVRYHRVFGTRADKLARLCRAEVELRALRRIRPRPPACRLTRDAAVAAAYHRWPALPELMPFHREGVQTNRDAAVVDTDRRRLLDRLERFAAGRRFAGSERAMAPRGHYDPQRARVRVRAALDRGERVVEPLAYRPFDVRWFAPIQGFCHRPRPALRAAMRRSSLALVTVRKDRGHLTWAHAGVTRHVPDSCYLSARSSCRTRAFPTHDAQGRPNLDPTLAARIAERIEGAVDVTDFTDYALAVLSAPSFRTRFDAALRIDYPRIPWPSGPGCWAAGVRLGRALREQLLTDPSPEQPDVEPALDSCTPFVRTFELGHHGVVASYLARRGGRVDAQRFRDLCARLERIERLLFELDAALAPP